MLGESRCPRWHWKVLGLASTAAAISLVVLLISYGGRFKNNAPPLLPPEAGAEGATSLNLSTPRMRSYSLSATSNGDLPGAKKGVGATTPSVVAGPPPKVEPPEKLKPAEIVFLERSTEAPDGSILNLCGILKRELVREAFLLAAREEFGLPTRDAAAWRGGGPWACRRRNG